jgi:formylglycine-generating enzyme required for sulfatase activity
LISPACERASALPPLGEALLVVDTDLPVPKLAGRLRVDYFTPRGTWYASRDLAAPRASPDDAQSDWPVSFAVALGSGDSATDVVLRLRAYPEGQVRDYLGERFQIRPSLCDQTACTGSLPPSCCPLVVPPPVAAAAGPMLVDSSEDVTPASEPDPAMTVDRLVLLHLTPGVVGKVLTVLHGACTGTMADITDFTNLSTCVDTENVRVPPPAAAFDPDPSVPTTLAGSFEQPYAAGCTATPRPGSTLGGVPLHDEEACVRGGGFVLGGRSSSDGSGTEGVPERAAFVTSFLMDRFEVTIGRYRKALADGYHPLEVLDTAGPFCAWTDSPGAAEETPLNCITWENARAFCEHEGGDLPTETQWEYAASQAGRGFKVHYPWGDGNGQPPTCSGVIYGRGADQPCAGDSPGTVSVAKVAQAGFDVTPVEGGAVVDLGGNVAELMLDSFAQYSANCWLGARLVDPSCTATTDQKVNRGGFFGATVLSLLSTNRDITPTGEYAGTVGFRCARPGAAR